MTDFINEDMYLAVKHGVAWMDENHPGWETKIDLGSLNMNDCFNCVIGQAVGDYYDVVRDYDSSYYNEHWAADHGFNIATDSWSEYEQARKEYAQLETIWSDVVRERLG